MSRRKSSFEEAMLYGSPSTERMRWKEDHWNRDPYDPEAKSYSYGQFVPDPDGEFISSNLWTGSDYSGSLVEKSNQKELVEQFGKLPGVHELSGGHNTYGLVFHVPTVMTWDESERTTLIDMLQGLENYPLINEEAHSLLEFEAQQEAWDDWAGRDFVREITKEYQLYDLTVLDEDAFLRFFEEMRERANEYWEIETGGSAHIRLERIAKKMTDRDLGKLLRDKVIEVEFDSDDERTPEEFVALVPKPDVPGQIKMSFRQNRRGVPRQLSAEELNLIWQDDDNGEHIQVNDSGIFYVAHHRAMEQISDNPRDFKAIKAWMDKHKFYPNIWHVNDHGNVTLLNRRGQSLGGLV